MMLHQHVFDSTSKGLMADIHILTSQEQVVWQALVWGEPGSEERTLHLYCQFYCKSPGEGRWTVVHMQCSDNNNDTRRQLITDDLSLSRLGRGRGGEATELISETQQLDNWQAIIQMVCLLAVYIVTTQGTLIWWLETPKQTQYDSCICNTFCLKPVLTLLFGGFRDPRADLPIFILAGHFW